MNILIIGRCGVGKTWLMKQLIGNLYLDKKGKLGKVVWQTNGDIYVLGNYDGSKFEGSDKLSMAVASDFEPLRDYLSGKTIIAEGDRFMNSKFISLFNPFIIKIEGDGKEGRDLRGSNQSERQLKTITTRVANIKYNQSFSNNIEALNYILEKIKNKYERQ